MCTLFDSQKSWSSKSYFVVEKIERRVDVILITESLYFLVLIILSFQVHLGGGGKLAGEGSAQQEVLLLENGASSRATSARRLPLGLRKYWHRRYAGAHTRVHSLLAACLSSRLIPDSSGFSDINVGKHDSHSLNAELRSMLVVPGCCLLERSKACIFRNVERRGTLRRESIFIYRSLVKCFDWQNCEDISRDNDHDRRVGSSWLSGILIQPSSFSNSF